VGGPLAKPIRDRHSQSTSPRPQGVGFYNELKVGPIEAIDGTPVIDIKPVLPQSADS